MKKEVFEKSIREKKLNAKTALYSKLDLLYQGAYSGPYKDLSYYGDDAIVIAALKDGRISGFGRPVVAFGDSNVLKKQIQRLYEISPYITYMGYPSEGGAVGPVAKFLLRKGATAQPYFTQIIDLTKSEEQLYSDLRKSYKQLVKQGKAEMSYLENLKIIHFQMHGKSTRSMKTWRIQDLMIAKGQAFVMTNGVAGVLIYHNKYSSYYACGASLANCNSHSVLWEAILHAKTLGVKTFEMGEQVFSGDEKLVNISKFKAGFGGKCFMRLLIK